MLPIRVCELNLSSSSSINFRLGLLTLKLRRQYNVKDFTAQNSIELPTSTPIALKNNKNYSLSIAYPKNLP